MSTFRHPVGPRPARVYWRRRLVLLLAVLAVVAIITFLLARPGSGSATSSSDSSNDRASASNPSPSPSGSASPSSSAQPSASASASAQPVASSSPSLERVEGGPCEPADIAVDALIDTNVYAAGQLPQLSFRITNTSDTSCTYNVGTTQQQFQISSGNEPYWSSKDCETGAVDSELLLEAGAAQTSTPIPWDRTRSSTSTCDTARPEVTAGGATYNLRVTVGEVESRLTSFLLN